MTGNWGPDMNLLIKAGVDAGADLRYYTFYAHLAGGPTAIGAGGENRVLSVMPFSENVAPEIGNAPKPRHSPRASARSISLSSPRQASAPSSSISRQR